MLNALQWFVDLGSIVVLPILIFIFWSYSGNETRQGFHICFNSWCRFCGLESSDRPVKQ